MARRTAGARSRTGSPVYALTSVLLAAMPLTALGAGLAVIGWAVRHTHRLSQAMLPALVWTPVATLAALAAYAVLTVVGGADAVDWTARGLPPGAQPHRLAAVGDRAADGRRAQLPVSAVRQPADTRLAARAGRQSRPRHRDFDGAADPEVHRRRGRRVPGRRHHGRVLRTGRRLDLRGQDDDRQARVPRQLRHHPAGPPGARRRTGRGVVGGSAQGQTRFVLAGQPADAVAPPARRGGCGRAPTNRRGG